MADLETLTEDEKRQYCNMAVKYTKTWELIAYLMNRCWISNHFKIVKGIKTVRYSVTKERLRTNKYQPKINFDLPPQTN